MTRHVLLAQNIGALNDAGSDYEKGGLDGLGGQVVKKGLSYTMKQMSDWLKRGSSNPL